MTQTDPANLEQDKILAPLLKRADVQALLRRGNEHKQLTYQEFMAALPEDDFDERQVDAVYRHMIEAGVTIVNQEELDDEPPEIELATIEVESAVEEAAEEVSDLALAAVTDDPVKLYLREIGQYPLLQPVEEMWLAMRISAAGYVVDVLHEAGPSRRTKAQRTAAQDVARAVGADQARALCYAGDDRAARRPGARRSDRHPAGGNAHRLASLFQGLPADGPIAGRVARAGGAGRDRCIPTRALRADWRTLLDMCEEQGLASARTAAHPERGQPAGAHARAAVLHARVRWRPDPRRRGCGL